ncbi:MAG: protein-L-isoaspartate O-methyltransferase [Pseudomonadota bacterium]
MDFKEARLNMVECQLRPNDVCNEELLEVMGCLRKERFLPDHLKPQAYLDCDLEFKKHRYLPSSEIIGKMLQIGLLDRCEQVLVIGDPSGYVAAILSKLVDMVFVVEEDEELLGQMKIRLSKADGFDNVRFTHGPLHEGYKEESGYDTIFIMVGIDYLPESISSQISDGGKAVFLKSQSCELPQLRSLAHLSVCYKHNNHLSEESLGDFYTQRYQNFCYEQTFHL